MITFENSSIPSSPPIEIGFFGDLPNEIIFRIFSYLPGERNIFQVCREFKQLATAYYTIYPPCGWEACKTNMLAKTLLSQYKFEPDEISFLFGWYAKRGNLEVMKHFSHLGADPSLQGYNLAISLAAEYGHKKIVCYLVQEKKVKFDDSVIELAAKYGHVEIVNYLLGRRTNPSPLAGELISTATQRGHVKIVKRLLQDRRIFVNLVAAACVSSACEKGRIDVLNVLLENESVGFHAEMKDNFTSRCKAACKGGHLEIVKKLFSSIKHEESVNEDHGLFEACEYKHSNIVEYLLKHISFTNSIVSEALELACRARDTATIETLLKDPRCEISKEVLEKATLSPDMLEFLLKHSQIDLSVEDNYLLAWAYINSQPSNMIALLKDSRVLVTTDIQAYTNYLLAWASFDGRIVDINTYLKDVKPPAKQKALIFATLGGHLSAVKELLKHADPSEGDLLRRASEQNSVDIVKELIKDKRVDPKDNQALSIACRMGSLEIVEILLKHCYDHSALEMACEYGHTAIVKKILEIQPTITDPQEKNLVVKDCENKKIEILKILLGYINPGKHVLEVWKAAREADLTEILELLEPYYIDKKFASLKESIEAEKQFGIDDIDLSLI